MQKHQSVDEVRNRLWIVATSPQVMGEQCESGRRMLGDFLPSLARPEPFGIGHRPFELLAVGGIHKVFERELVRLAHAVRPVGVDAEEHHV